MTAPLTDVRLEDKYIFSSGRFYLSATQALVRLLIMQRLRDEAAGLHTGGFVSGYRGSPLGPLDKALWQARPHLEAHHIKFQPGVNEDLAATAVWGTQQLKLLGPSKYDGVFAMWYGKGPGVDRSGDVLKHMNHFGTAKHGGVLLVAGDDHASYSSTLPHQSEHMFAAAVIPVLYPSNVQEYLDFGIHGWAMSRFSGCVVGFKAISDTAESSASVDGDPFRVQVKLPEDFDLPPDGLGLNSRIYTGSIRLQSLQQEALMQDYKIYAALAYARANKLNHTVIDAPKARLGIITSGKSYVDVREALDELGIDERAAKEIGIRVFKVAMPWPLEPESVREFATGLEEILVVEEKRQVVEYQLKEQLYNWREDVRPRVIGKFDEKGEWVPPHGHGQWLLTSKGDFTVAQIARVIAGRIGRFHQSDKIKARLAFLAAKEEVLSRAIDTPARTAYYCAGCPHNTSTRTPEGSFALAGIGCHTMGTVIYPDSNKTVTHMGGEGATWIGQAPFSDMPHMFVNLGDGTYFHSGYLAIRAAVGADVNITYKILYNDAVAMTGGQPVDGPLSVPQVAREVAAEGVKRIAVVTDNVERYRDRSGLPAFATVHDRADLDAVQRELREQRGVSVLIYDQTCAAEKRRRRKHGKYPIAPQRVFINEAVCEGCGDCGVQSNCVAILPLETEFGRKRTIDQSSCNQDYSCLKGFCPSFVTVEGAKVRRPRAAGKETDAVFPALPEPESKTSLERPYNILVTGIGGTGVITIGALLGMASHLEGKGVSVLDMTGLSQKNGSVMSHVRIAASPRAIFSQAIAMGEADVILGCDMLAAGSQEAISKTRPGRTVAVINTHEQPTGQFTREPDWQFPAEEVRALITEAVAERAHFLDGTRIATALMGDAIATNLFMLGYAYQRGLVPLSEAALMRAIELNEVAIEANKQAFVWGRRAAVDLAKVERVAFPENNVVVSMPQSVDALIQRRAEFLTQYQNRRYAERYERFVREVQAAERPLGGERLTRAVAQNLFKLMAYKDEYEVARLYSSGDFERKLAGTFEGEFKVTFHLAPPFLGRDASGHLKKREFGPWMRYAFRLLAKLKFLRGTPFDLFGRTQERRAERRLIADYRNDVTEILGRLTRERLDDAVEFACVPEHIRGFGHVKQANVEKARVQAEAIKTRLMRVPPAAAPASAAVNS